jgi:YidC/Oxa1 family membrane protein insertase
MDIKRTILIVALAIVSYVMVLKWNQDYGQAALPTQNTAASTTAPALPDGVPAGNASADVPSANAESSAAELAPVAVSKDLIRVKTDVLELAIDPVGGDIVQLTLPKYPRRQDHPEIPFQLFDNGGERVYLAQSGLTGANGPDARANGRPLYSSEQRVYQLADGQDQLVVDLKFSDNFFAWRCTAGDLPGVHPDHWYRSGRFVQGTCVRHRCRTAGTERPGGPDDVDIAARSVARCRRHLGR